MNLTQNQYARLAGALIILLASALGIVTGYDLAIIQPRQQATANLINATFQVEAPTRAGTIYTNIENLRVRHNLNGMGATTLDSTLAVAGAQTNASTLTVTGAMTVTGNLAANGVAFSGPVKYGTATTYTSGTSISHGFATTPTICIFSPREITSTLTITTTGFSCDTATHSNPIYWICGK